MQSRFRSTTLIRLAAVSAAASFAVAQEPVDPAPIIGEMDTFIVTVSRVEQTWLDAPYAIEVLDDAALRERAVRTLPEALSQTPGVFVQKTSHGQGSPVIRGLTGYHNLALIDGVRLNHAAFRSGPNQYWNTVDPLGISRIELARSQGSVLYGSDAVGGTLQAFTHRPRYAETGFLATGRSYSRLASGEHSFTQRGEVSLSEAGQWGLLLGGSFKDFGDVRAAGLGRLPKTGYDEWDADAKFELFLNDHTRLTVFHQQVHVDDAWRTHRTLFSRSFRGTQTGDERARILDQSRLLSYVQLEGEPMAPLFDRYTLSVSHQRHSEERFRERSDGRVDQQGFDIDSYGAWGEFEKELGFTDLAYGASYYHDRSDSFRTDFNADGSLRGRRIQGPIGDDGSYELASAFLNSSTPITERLDLDLGARFTHASANVGRVEDPVSGSRIGIAESWDNVVGSGRLLYKLDEAGQFRVYGGVSQAFRAPNFSDLSRLDSARSNEIETPAPGLDPEQFLTYEIGVKAQTNNLSGTLSYFYTDINDLITRAPTGRLIDGDSEVTKANAGDGFVHGIELGGAWDLGGGWSAFGGFAWIDGEAGVFPTSDRTLRDEPLSRLMPTNGYGGLRWDSADGKFWLEGVVTAFGDGDRLSSRDIADVQRIPPGGTPGYTIGTLRAGWQVKDNIVITGAVENLLDEEYRAHGSGQNEPGTNFILGVEVRF